MYKLFYKYKSEKNIKHIYGDNIYFGWLVVDYCSGQILHEHADMSGIDRNIHPQIGVKCLVDRKSIITTISTSVAPKPMILHSALPVAQRHKLEMRRGSTRSSCPYVKM